MKFDHEQSHVLADEPRQEPVPEPAPPKHKTGNKYLDEGAVCDRPDRAKDAKCLFDHEQRLRIIERIGTNIPVIHSSYLTALGKARVEVLMHKKAGWGFAAELLFNLATAALTAGVGFAVTKLAAKGVRAFLDKESTTDKAIEMARDGSMSADAAEKVLAQGFVRAQTGKATFVVNNASRALKPVLKSQFDHFPPEVALKGKFIDLLMNNASQLFTKARNEALDDGDDSVLLTMLGAMDPEHLSVSYFTAAVSDLLARFDASHVAEVGPWIQQGVEAGTTETVLVIANGRSRFAIVQFGEIKHVGRLRGGESLETDGSDRFVGFVDDDLTGVARMAQHQLVGEVKVIDASKHKLSRAAALDAWVESTRTGRKA
jgi:hypothetical protein